MRFLKGVMLAESQRTAEAIVVFTLLNEDYPELAEPYNNLAVLYASQAQYEKARAALEAAMRGNPGYATAYENIGDVYARLAAQAYASALQLEQANAALPPRSRSCERYSPPDPAPRAAPRLLRIPPRMRPDSVRIAAYVHTARPTRNPLQHHSRRFRMTVIDFRLPGPSRGHPCTRLGLSTAAWAQKVKLATSMGDIVIELDAAKAPKSVDNFLQYVKAGHYDGTVFHRVIDNFMIQGGGMTADLKQKPTRPPIPLESRNGLNNVRGSVAMARTSDPNSATSQFFISVKDNAFLDAANARDGNGYTVFGKVVSGMDVVDKIRAVPTGANDVPVQPVTIKTATLEK